MTRSGILLQLICFLQIINQSNNCGGHLEILQGSECLHLSSDLPSSQQDSAHAVFSGQGFYSGQNLGQSPFIQLIFLCGCSMLCLCSCSFISGNPGYPENSHTHRLKLKQCSNPECWTLRFPGENTSCRVVVGKAGISI